MWECDKCNARNWEARTICHRCEKARDDIEFQCPECEGELIVNSEGAGLEVDCPHCSAIIRIPTAETAAAMRQLRLKAEHCFVSHLRLKTPCLDEFLSSWVSEANRADLIDGYRESPDHVILGRYVFKRTPFFCRAEERIKEERRRQAAVAKQRMIDALLRRSPSGDCVTVMVGPGVVRYILFERLNQQTVAIALEGIHSLSKSPRLKIPYDEFGSYIESFLGGKSFDEQLGILAEFCNVHARGVFSSRAHYCFVSHLRLETPCLDEFLSSWMPGVTDNDLIDSYQESPDYVILGYEGDRYVFKRTPFFCRAEERIEEERLGQEAEAMEEASAKSSFDTFVYLMEDLRNGRIKIGHSKRPKKRESTLQSEQPETVLRFAIPAAQEEEAVLHKRYAVRRVRGEWFELPASEVHDVVTYLMGQGDRRRMQVDYEWLGRLTAESQGNA